MKSKLSLQEFVSKSTQFEAAKSLGVTQAAVQQAVNGTRKITVVTKNGVAVDAHELKPYGKFR